MKTLEKNAINVWGERGRLWINQLPEIIAQLSQHWDLYDIKPVDNMSYNYVAKAIQKINKPVVLKISCDQQLIEDEYNALKHFKGQGSIKVLNIHHDWHALLLEQAIPGDILKEHYSENISGTIKIYTDVVKALASQVRPSGCQYTPVKKWCEAIDRIHDTRIEPSLLIKAKVLRDFLLSSIEKEYLCHGDLHLENIIHHENQWLSIDPKGVIGEIAFEAAAFDLIDDSEWSEHQLIQDKILHRTHLIASLLHINHDRLLAWMYLRVIISAQWFIEDQGNPDKMLKLASVFYPLLTSQYEHEA
jgi:streptomycin 6-kinase